MPNHSQADYDGMLDAVRTFVSVRFGIEKSTLTECTSIEQDVQTAGLDTYTFYKEFFEEFHIGNPEEFEGSKYVASENLELGKFIRGLFSSKVRQENRVKAITLGHLARVGLAKTWFEEATSDFSYP